MQKAVSGLPLQWPGVVNCPGKRRVDILDLGEEFVVVAEPKARSFQALSHLCLLPSSSLVSLFPPS